MQRCCKCHQWCELDRFARRSDTGRLRTNCKDCQNAHERDKRASDPNYRVVKNAVARRYNRTPNGKRNQIARNRRASLRFNHGMDLDEYDRRVLEQGGVCAICGRSSESQRYGCLAVDHDHKTGLLRELLCDPCNLGLGKFKDDPQLLDAAAAYLQR